MNTALPAGDETLIAAVIPPPAPEPEPELPPELDPESLIGNPASDVEQRLGLPVLRRLEGTTEVWQYRMESCIIDFVLPEGTTVLARTAAIVSTGKAMMRSAVAVIWR